MHQEPQQLLSDAIAPHAGKRFAELPTELQQRITKESPWLAQWESNPAFRLKDSVLVTGFWYGSWQPLAEAIAPYVEKPFAELPSEVRWRIEDRGGWLAKWDDCPAGYRLTQAQGSDNNSNPALLDTSEAQTDFFIGFWPKDRVQYWFDLEAVTANDAARLLCLDDPDEDPKTTTMPAVYLGTSFNLLRRLFSDADRDGRLRNLHDWIAVVLGNPALRHLESVSAWAACSAVFLKNATLLPDASASNTDTNAGCSQTTPESAEDAPANAKAAPIEGKPATSQTLPDWKSRVQIEAFERMVRLRKAGANPTVHSILNEMVRWCTENNVRGTRGCIPTAHYLRVHVLGGKHWRLPM